MSRGPWKVRAFIAERLSPEASVSPCQVRARKGNAPAMIEMPPPHAIAAMLVTVAMFVGFVQARLSIEIVSLLDDRHDRGRPLFLPAARHRRDRRAGDRIRRVRSLRADHHLRADDPRARAGRHRRAGAGGTVLGGGVSVQPAARAAGLAGDRLLPVDGGQQHAGAGAADPDLRRAGAARRAAACIEDADPAETPPRCWAGWRPLLAPRPTSSSSRSRSTSGWSVWACSISRRSCSPPRW